MTLELVGMGVITGLLLGFTFNMTRIDRDLIEHLRKDCEEGFERQKWLLEKKHYYEKAILKSMEMLLIKEGRVINESDPEYEAYVFLSKTLKDDSENTIYH